MLTFFHNLEITYFITMSFCMIIHSGLPPSIEVNNLEITLLYNYVYSEILMLRNVEQTRETTLYTTAARVLYRGNDCVRKNF